MATISIEYYGVKASGKTVTEAKQNAGKIIERAMKDSYFPTLVAGKKYSAFVFNTPDGWSYTFMRNDEMTGIQRRFSSSMGFVDEQDAIMRATAHVANADWDFKDPDTSDMLKEYPELQRQFTRMCNWQRGYKAARADGLTDSQARDVADTYHH